MESEFLSKDNINGRFLAAVDYLLTNKIVKNKSTLARLFGISSAKLTEILGCRMKAGVDMIAILCSLYGISPEWLLLNKGEMFVENVDPQSIEVNNPPVYVDNINNSGALNVQDLIERYIQLIGQKDEKITELAEEIGMLKERIRNDRQKNVSAAPIANAG